MDLLAMVLDALDEAVVSPRPLPDGFNPWEPVVYDAAKAKSAAMKRSHARSVELHGVDVKCQNPGCTNTKRVHPAKAKTTRWCSNRCSQIMQQARAEGRDQPMPINPFWLGRKELTT